MLLLFKGDGMTAEALEHNQKLAAVMNFHHLLHNWEVGIAVGAFLIAIGVGYIAWHKGPKLGHH